MALTVQGQEIACNDQGFLLDKQQWNPEVAEHLAAREGLILQEGHWEILLFMRQFYQEFQYLPNARVFTKAIRHQLGEHKGNSRYLLQLFPQGPLKYACKIAGLPKPPSCL